MNMNETLLAVFIEHEKVNSNKCVVEKLFKKSNLLSCSTICFKNKLHISKLKQILLVNEKNASINGPEIQVYQSP